MPRTTSARHHTNHAQPHCPNPITRPAPKCNCPPTIATRITPQTHTTVFLRTPQAVYTPRNILHDIDPSCGSAPLSAELIWQQETRSSVEQRREAAEGALQELAAARAKALGSALPTQIRYQSLTLSHVSAMLAREQRMHMRALLEIFPLRINALRAASAGDGGAGAGGGAGAAGGSPIQITICNLRLPESMAAPPGGWQDPQVRGTQ